MQYRALSPMLQNEHQCMILERLQLDFDEERQARLDHHETLFKLINSLKASVHRSTLAMVHTGRDTAKAIPALKGIPLVRDCSELQRNGITLSGVYPLRLPSRNIVNVWCDMELGNGGWTIIQRRQDGSINFTRTWDDYAFGFGNPNSEYWLGNENIYRLTTYMNYSLRVDLWDWEDNHVYALYDYFRVDSEKEFYRLKIEGFSGNAGDAMSRYHNNMKFSTIDSDNDEWNLSCAKKDEAGWWFRSCGFASLNGLYVENGTIDIAPDGIFKGIIWYNWKQNYGYSMKRTEMKIKPMVAVKIDKEMEKSLTERVDIDNMLVETELKSGSGDATLENHIEKEADLWAKNTLKQLHMKLTPEELQALKQLFQGKTDPSNPLTQTTTKSTPPELVTTETDTFTTDDIEMEDYDYDEHDTK